MKLIVEPNFFSKFVLILGLYDALESSGLKSQPFMSYRNCLTRSYRNPLYGIKLYLQVFVYGDGLNTFLFKL